MASLENVTLHDPDDERFRKTMHEIEHASILGIAVGAARITLRFCWGVSRRGTGVGLDDLATTHVH
jgi:hypothetical protein